ncbi:hypothetical protein TWF102_005517 [Orbilia oligospora]|uniref:Uncharacterized protein n=1 Tax=Orbilia oligospora TaxID=2813651 RepID=A0A7C8JLF5_ORBOL|nr:hypothetical protein TWF102_005517 [Orbilia oligospora]
MLRCYGGAARKDSLSTKRKRKTKTIVFHSFNVEIDRDFRIRRFAGADGQMLEKVPQLSLELSRGDGKAVFIELLLILGANGYIHPPPANPFNDVMERTFMDLSALNARPRCEWVADPSPGRHPAQR